MLPSFYIMNELTMTLFLLTFIGLINYVSSEMRMMLVWGEPDSVQNAKENKTLTWDNCIESCFVSQECVMAWQSNDSCLFYNYNSIGSVSQTNAEDGSIVAWKVNSPDNECPIGSNPPTFDNKNATGTLFLDNDPTKFPMYIYYNIYSDGDKWKMSYSVNSSCTSNFADIVTRQDGSGLCVNDWYNNSNDTFSYDRGIELCKNKTAFLAGLVYPEDFAWFVNDAITVMRPLLEEPDSYARIDGMRTVACRATPSTPECMSPKGFIFTGPPVPHFDNYNWVTNSSAQATPNDNCLVLVFQGNNTIKVDVRGCSLEMSPLSTRMIFCSNTAWIGDAIDYD